MTASEIRPALGAVESGVRRAAVIGAGAMGGGIAAQFANAGIPVDLLDQPGGDSRDGPAEAGLARQIKIGGFMAPEAAALVRTGNVADHLGRLAEADWIVEAVIEDLAIKRDLYARLEAVRRPGSIVSSNTSTIPRAALIEGLPESFGRDFLVTHFFNPPRVMRLVEFVDGPETPPDLLRRAEDSARAALGKTVVFCRDTPGFIANRIGCFWMAAGVLEAARLGLSVEQADAVNAALGTPRTGVFGLFDLVGIDLIPHVWGSLMKALPAEDAFHEFDLPGWSLAQSLIAAGRHGRKTGAGFYRRPKGGAREALDLVTGEYRPEAPFETAELPGGGRDLAALLEDQGPLGRYARSLLSQVAAYAAEHGPAIAGDVGAIDTAIELGYSWRAGPFRLAERAGVARIAAALEAEGRSVPALLKAGASGFYAGGRALLTSGAGSAEPPAPSLLSGARRILGNEAARLVDLGEGVAGFEITRKMNALAPAVFDALEETLAKAGSEFRALVLGNDDPRAFSAGADLDHFLTRIDAGRFDEIDAFVKRGQELFLGLKYASVPVVAAAHGFALGGGCEFLLHADAVVAQAELTAGLPEANVGLIPGWGGVTQLLLRAQELGRGPEAPFATIFGAGSSGSALDARRLGILRPSDAVVMSRADLLPQARALALRLAKGYAPPAKARLSVAGPAAAEALLAPVRAAAAKGEATAADLRLAERLARVVTGGDSPGEADEAAFMALEREALTLQAREPTTRARIAHLLKTGKPLRN